MMHFETQKIYNTYDGSANGSDSSGTFNVFYEEIFFSLSKTIPLFLTNAGWALRNKRRKVSLILYILENPQGRLRGCKNNYFKFSFYSMPTKFQKI